MNPPQPLNRTRYFTCINFISGRTMLFRTREHSKPEIICTNGVIFPAIGFTTEHILNLRAADFTEITYVEAKQLYPNAEL